jgi:hypothetical protein
MGYAGSRVAEKSTQGGLTFTSPKCGKSRSVRLTPSAVKALEDHRERQLEEKLRLAGLWKENGLVFTTVIGTPMDRDNLVKRSFKPLMGRTRLPQIRFHDLRHPPAVERHAPEGGTGDAEIRRYFSNDGHLLARAARYAERGSRRDRAGTFLTGCSTVAVNWPGAFAGSSTCLAFLSAKRPFIGARSAGLEPATF